MILNVFLKIGKRKLRFDNSLFVLTPAGAYSINIRKPVFHRKLVRFVKEFINFAHYIKSSDFFRETGLLALQSVQGQTCY